MSTQAQSNYRGTGLGILIILIGLVLLLNNLGMIPESMWWLPQWYTLIAAIGVYNLFTGNRSSGMILLIVGAFFLLRDIGVFSLSWSYVWPIIIILVGTAFLFRDRISGTRTISADEDFFDVSSLFGGTKQMVRGNKLKGGKVTSIFGGSEIDLSQAVLSDGAVIDVFTMFGGTEIRVPENWRINLQTTAILGGFDTKRSEPADGPILTIKGFVILGGGEIKS
jgi:predicted membrane protein